MSEQVQTDEVEMRGHPASVLVGTIRYRVTSDADEWLRVEHRLRISEHYGLTEHKSATIYLNPENTEDVTRTTLWHEVLHALCETPMGAPSWRKLGAEQHQREEAVVRRIEGPTLLALIQNPELVAYLTVG